MDDVPMLLIYRIDKNLGKETKAGTRTRLNTCYDVVGFSIIVPGEPSGGDTHAKAVTVKIPQ